MTDNLGDLISRSVAHKLDSEFVEKAVDARIEKLVAEAVDAALRSYSDTGQLVSKAVADALRVNDLDLPRYGETVAQILKKQIENSVAELVTGRLSADMQELLSLAPKEVKLSAIAEEMLVRHRDYGAYGEVITVIVEHNEYGSTWVYLHDAPDTEKYRCEHRMLIRKDGVVASATISDIDLKKSTHIGRTYGLEQKLRAYVACGTKIIIDEDHVVTGVGDY